MPAKRVSMRRIREVLRLKHACGATDRAIARSMGVARSTIALYLERAAAAGLSWPLPDTLTDCSATIWMMMRVASFWDAPEGSSRCLTTMFPNDQTNSAAGNAGMFNPVGPMTRLTATSRRQVFSRRWSVRRRASGYAPACSA